jgi:predicted amidohydrolase
VDIAEKLLICCNSKRGIIYEIGNDANGNVIVKADDTEQLILAEIDLQAVERVRSRKPYTTLRRKELYK